MPVSPAVAETPDALLAALLGALDRVEWTQRQLFPPRALELAERLAPHAERLIGPLGALEVGQNALFPIGPVAAEQDAALVDGAAIGQRPVVGPHRARMVR